jgi:hypothetical protein
MAMGDKLFEEQGKMNMTYVKSIDDSGMTIVQSFSSEITGAGRFPSGMNMGSGTICIHQSGMAHGKWNGMMMTKDNEMIVWKGTGHSKRAGQQVNGILVINFMTKSEKYAWMNSMIAVIDIQGTMMEFKSIGMEWK